MTTIDDASFCPGFKVLLVDDEEAFVTTLHRRLKSRGIDASVAFGGSEALASIERNPTDVIVLDLNMPNIDGLEVLRRVKASGADTEVIILTAHGSDAEERLVLEMGAFAHLTKPVEIDELTLTMRDACLNMRRHPKEGGI